MKALPILVALGTLHACVEAEDADLGEGEIQRAEIIEVHGCRPGTLGNGEICIDPLEGGGDGGGGPGPTGGDGGQSGPGGGGGGGGDTGGPGPKPDRKQCGPELGVQGCLDCCMYNHLHVDGWECNRKRTKKAKKLCWEKAIEDLSVCQVATCNRHTPDPIITTVSP